MNPEALLANLDAANDGISEIMNNADRTFRALVGFGVPPQYGIHTGGAKPVIIDSDNIDVIAKEASSARLDLTLDDYKTRLRKFKSAFSTFIADDCKRSSSAMNTMMSIELGWAFFYWCVFSRLIQEQKMPTSILIKTNVKYFGGYHG